MESFRVNFGGSSLRSVLSKHFGTAGFCESLMRLDSVELRLRC